MNNAKLPNSDPSPLGSTLEEARERRRQNPEYVNAEKRNDILERLRSREPFPGRLDAAIAEIERLQSENERLRSAEQSKDAATADLVKRLRERHGLQQTLLYREAATDDKPASEWRLIHPDKHDVNAHALAESQKLLWEVANVLERATVQALRAPSITASDVETWRKNTMRPDEVLGFAGEIPITGRFLLNALAELTDNA